MRTRRFRGRRAEHADKLRQDLPRHGRNGVAARVRVELAGVVPGCGSSRQLLLVASASPVPHEECDEQHDHDADADHHDDWLSQFCDWAIRTKLTRTIHAIEIGMSTFQPRSMNWS